MEGENKATRIKQLYGLLYSGLQTDFGLFFAINRLYR